MNRKFKAGDLLRIYITNTGGGIYKSLPDGSFLTTFEKIKKIPEHGSLVFVVGNYRNDYNGNIMYLVQHEDEYFAAFENELKRI